MAESLSDEKLSWVIPGHRWTQTYFYASCLCLLDVLSFHFGANRGIDLRYPRAQLSTGSQIGSASIERARSWHIIRLGPD
jgi:hypothetical protein